MMIRLVVVFVAVLALPVWAQLPEIQLDAITPAGAQRGQTVKVQLHGTHLTEVSHLVCEHKGIQGSIKDGHYEVTVAADVTPGVYDMRVGGRFGLSNPRAFVVGDSPEVLESGDHHQQEKAMVISPNSVVHGQGDAQRVDWYRIEPSTDGIMHVSVMAERIDSRMDPTVVICDQQGLELQREHDGEGRDVMCRVSVKVGVPLLIGIHDQLYEGSASHFYRLEVNSIGDFPRIAGRSLASVALRELDGIAKSAVGSTVTSLPTRMKDECEVGKAKSFDLQLEKATNMAVEVYSDRFGQPSDYRLTVLRVEGEKLHKVIDNDDQGNDSHSRGFHTGTRDPVVRFRAEAGTPYRIDVRNQFRGGPGFQLVFRNAAPNYYLIAASEAPAEKGNTVSRRATTVRAGGVAHWPIFLLRRDGFAGEVKVSAKGLPEGVRVYPCIIPEGKSQGMLTVTAAESVADWGGVVTIQGTGQLGEDTVSRQACGAMVLWTVGDANNQRHESRLTEEVTLAVVGKDKEPLLCVPEKDTYETSLGGKLEISLKVTREGEQKAPFKIVPTMTGLAKPKEVTLANKAAEVKLSLELINNNGNQFRPGDYVMVGRAREGKVTYRVNPQAAERAEAERLRLEEELKTLSGQIAEESKKRLEALTKAKDAAVKGAEEATKQAAAKDHEHSFLTHPVTIRILDAPVRLAELPAVELTADKPQEINVSLERLFGFKDEVVLELQAPQGVKGLKNASATLAKDVKEITLTWTLEGEQEEGEHQANLTASMTFNGQKVSTTVPITVRILASSPQS